MEFADLMDSPQILAFALEGQWQIYFEGLDVDSTLVSIQNRALAGENRRQRISGDFRIDGNSVIAFIRVRDLAGGNGDEVILQAQGKYHPSTLVMLGSTIEEHSLGLRVVLKR